MSHQLTIDERDDTKAEAGCRCHAIEDPDSDYHGCSCEGACPCHDVIDPETKAMGCGHPTTSVVACDEGTQHCAGCEREAREEQPDACPLDADCGEWQDGVCQLSTGTEVDSCPDCPLGDCPPSHPSAGCCPCPDAVSVRQQDEAFDEPSCRVCGCTSEHGCPGGCWWVEDPEGGDLCSTCAALLYPVVGPPTPAEQPTPAEASTAPAAATTTQAAEPPAPAEASTDQPPTRQPRRRHRWDPEGDRLRCRRCGLTGRMAPGPRGGTRLEVLEDGATEWQTEVGECPGQTDWRIPDDPTPAEEVASLDEDLAEERQLLDELAARPDSGLIEQVLSAGRVLAILAEAEIQRCAARTLTPHGEDCEHCAPQRRAILEWAVANGRLHFSRAQAAPPDQPPATQVIGVDRGHEPDRTVVQVLGDPAQAEHIGALEAQLGDARERLAELETRAAQVAPASGSVRRPLPEERQSVTHRFEVGGHKGYLIVGLYPDERPGELFLVISKEGSSLRGWADAWARSVSLLLQYGVPLEDLVKKFGGFTFEPGGWTAGPVGYARSIVDYVVRWMGHRFGGEAVQGEAEGERRAA